MSCCNAIKNLGCIYSCDVIQIGENAPTTGIYTLETYPEGVKLVKTTNTAANPLVFASGYLNEDATTVFKIIKPDGNYFETSDDEDCFQVTVQPASNPELANVTVTPVTCADATAVLKDTAGATILTEAIASGTTETITAPNASAVLKDTAGATLSTTAIKSNETKNITAPDSTAVLKDTAAATISTTALKSNETKNITAPDGTAVLRDSATTLISTTAIKSNETKNITAPDGTAVVKDSGGTTITSAAVKSNETKNITIPDGIYPTPTIPTTSLYLHLDASGLVLNTTNTYGIVDGTGKISQLTDRSGNGRHFTQGTGANQPVLVTSIINSLNGCHFNGSKWLFNTVKANWTFLHNGSPWMMYIYGRLYDSANPMSEVPVIGNNAGAVGNRGFYIDMDDSAVNNGMRFNVTNGGTSVYIIVAQEIKTLNSFGLMMAGVYDYVSTDRGFIFGDLGFSASNASAAVSGTAPNLDIAIGAFDGTGLGSSLGDRMVINEIALYSTNHSLMERGDVIAYFGFKYGQY